MGGLVLGILFHKPDNRRQITATKTVQHFGIEGAIHFESVQRIGCPAGDLGQVFEKYSWAQPVESWRELANAQVKAAGNRYAGWVARRNNNHGLLTSWIQGL